MTRTRTALIIGGGIAGPATAMALQKVGIDPVIYEAYPAGAYGTGAFLTLAPNGIDALRILGADKPALAAGFPTPAITLRSYTGKRLGQTRTGGSLPDGTTSHTIKRADLHRVLLDEAASRGRRIEHGKRLIAAEQVGDRVQAAFADGSTAQGDVLIGCDGVHSTVRSIIDPEAPTPTYAGLLNTGGYAHGVQAGNGPGHYEMIFGKRAFFGYVAAPGGQVWGVANLPRPRPRPAAGPQRPGLAAAAGRGLRRRRRPRHRPDRGHPAAHGNDPGPHPPAPARLVPPSDDRHRRRRPRPLTHLGPGRLPGHRRRGRARPMPARPAQRPSGVRRLRGSPPAPC